MPTLMHNWQPPASGPPDSYNVYEGPAPGQEALLVNVAGTTTNYSHSVVPGPYSAYVTAVVGGVESAPSNETGVFVVAPFNIPQGTALALLVLGAGKPSNARHGAVTWDVFGPVQSQADFENPDAADSPDMLDTFLGSGGLGVVATSDNPGEWGLMLFQNKMVVAVPLGAGINLLSQPYQIRYDDGT